MNRRQALGTMGSIAAALWLPSWLITPARRRSIDLADFCLPAGKKIYRYAGMDRPHAQGDWTYATDAKICVRVEPLSGDVRVGEVKYPPAWNLPWDHDQCNGWRTLPDHPVVHEYEDWCECENGLVEPFSLCSCGGDGCKKCKGRGVTGCDECPKCKGKGRRVQPVCVEAGDVFMGHAYYKKLRALGGVEMCGKPVLPPLANNDAIRFRFAEGCGLLMLMDADVVRHNISQTKEPSV